MRIKNWNEFQHFKDRTPPWIKLYRYLLDDPDWHELDGETAKTLVMLWLVASEDKDKNGKLPCTRKLSFRLRMSEDILIKQIQQLEHWVEQDDISLISDRYQDDAPETETETETEGETEADKGSSSDELLPVVFLSIPLNKKGTHFEVTEDHVSELKESFPGVDVECELRKCRQWNIDNPKHRKTKGGIRKHISSWLGRVQDRSRPARGNNGVGLVVKGAI